jgi:hypothetical protein
MKIKSSSLLLPVLLLAASAFFYIMQNIFFKRPEDTFFYMLQDLSFVPIQVLFVTLILDRLLKKREKQSLLNKMNMVIGVFYNEIGNELLDLLERFSVNFKKISSQLQISVLWEEKDFNNKMKDFDIHPEDLKCLILKKQGLLNMLANPNLLEHDSFTNLLWAVFHVADELMHRKNFENLPQTDYDHLRGDLLRAYVLIVNEWLSYMKHLKKDYPYLFSIAVRTNPFNPEADITVVQ